MRGRAGLYQLEMFTYLLVLFSHYYLIHLSLSYLNKVQWSFEAKAANVSTWETNQSIIAKRFCQFNSTEYVDICAL